MAWLCVDAGTSVIKSVVYAEDGSELAIARSSVAVHRPQPQFSEQDMDSVWQAVIATAQQAVRQAAVPIHAIATTAQGDGSWLVDAEGRPVRPAILWNDGRASSVVDAWQASGALDTGSRISGSMTYPGLPNSIWQWFAAQEPASLERAAASLTCNGWLYLQLTGIVAADLSDASNPFYDVVARDYSHQLLEFYSAEPYRHLLPPVLAADAAPGTLQPTAAAALGLSAGIPVLMAPYDIVTTAWGVGCIANRQACVILGTTICAEAITDSFHAESAGTTLALEAPGTYLRAMPTLTGCEALGWLAGLLHLDSIDALEQLAHAAPLGADRLLFLPYLSTAGERSPFLNPAARGSWSNLSLQHNAHHLARSVYEGLSFVIRECLTAARGDSTAEIRVCGGGARSAFWCQMIADVTGCTVIRSTDQELGAKGALLFGRVKLGEAADLQSAFAAAGGKEAHFTPDTARHTQYDALFTRFLRTRQANESLWASAHTEQAHA